MMDMKKEEMAVEKEQDKQKKNLGKGIADFSEYLSDFIEKLCPKGVDNLKKFGGITLNNFDFKVPIDPVLVSSIPGRFSLDGSEGYKSNFSYGLERLKQIMLAFPLSKKPNPAKVRVVYQTSSVGQLSSAFLVRFLGILSLH